MLHIIKIISKEGVFENDVEIPARAGDFVLADLRSTFPATEEQLKKGVNYTLLQVQNNYAKKDHGHALVTQSVAGFMSSTDKTKLDGLSGPYLLLSGGVMQGSIGVDTINGATHGNAIMRQLVSNGNVLLGSDAQHLRLVGNETRPYYTTSAGTDGSQLALLSDLSSKANATHSHDILVSNYTSNGGMQSPSAIGTNATKVFMMNGFKGLTMPNLTGYFDAILMNAYTWNDVPYATAIAVGKNVNRAWIARGGNTENWSEVAEFVTSRNVSEYAASPSHTHQALTIKQGASSTTYTGGTARSISVPTFSLSGTTLTITLPS